MRVRAFTQDDAHVFCTKEQIDEHIIEIIEGNSQITALDLSKILYVSERTIERDLKKLTDEKVIEYTGSAKDGYWRVNK